jgi:NADPH2:quinone reductase
MKAVRVHALGGPEVMTYEDVEVPRPGPGEAQVKVAASGLNYLDVQYRIGRVKAPLPFVIGSEASGFVTEVGPGVTDLKVGDRVAWAMTLGSYAEYAVVPAWKLVVLPPDLDMKVAAGVMLQGLTAHYLTHSTFALQPGQTALVHAAAGGVGSVIVQVARLIGARVIATAGTEAKAALAREAGAHDVDFRQGRRRRLRLGGEGHVRGQSELSAPARHARAVWILERDGAAVRPGCSRHEGLALPDSPRAQSVHGHA